MEDVETDDEIIGLSTSSESEEIGEIAEVATKLPRVEVPRRKFFQPYKPRFVPNDSNFLEKLLPVASSKLKECIESVSSTNTTAKCVVSSKLPLLRQLVTRVPNSSYNEAKMNAMGVLVMNPFVLVRVFPNGVCTSIGANSELAARIALRKAARKLAVAGVQDARFENFRLTSLSCVAKVKERWVDAFEDAVDARPAEFHPDEDNFGFVWIVPEFRCRVKVFLNSLKLVVVGARGLEELLGILERFCAYL